MQLYAGKLKQKMCMKKIKLLTKAERIDQRTDLIKKKNHMQKQILEFLTTSKVNSPSSGFAF